MRRWELERGLPIHRVPGETRGAVFAFTNELEEWLRRPQSQSDEPGEAVVSSATQQVRQISQGVPSQAQGFSSNRRLLPSAIAISLAIAVFGGVYSYRQTARFGARAAAQSPATQHRHLPTLEAQEFYLKGRYYWSKRTPEDLNKAVDYFTRAIVQDPAYAQAFMGLADCYNLLREFSVMPPQEAYPRAMEAAQKAVELDDSSAEAHNSLAFVTFYWNWDAAIAETEFKRALALNPNFVQAHHWYATFLMSRKRYTEALDQIEQARQLDPSSTAVLADKGFILWHAGRVDEALALLQQLEATDDSLASTHAYLGRMYFVQHDYASSFAEQKRAAQLKHDASALAIVDAAERGFAAGGILGMYESMLPVQQKLFVQGRTSAYDLAVTCTALGRNADALRYLKNAFDNRDTLVMFIGDSPTFNPLHGDQDFNRLVRRVADRVTPATL